MAQKDNGQVVRCNRVRLWSDTGNTGTMLVVGDRVSTLWNAGNYLGRQSFLAKEGVPSGIELERRMMAHETYRALPSDIAQEVLKKLSEA